MDIIGPSDVAYDIICLVQNSKMVWLETQTNFNDAGQENRKSWLFTAGEGKKQVFEECIWNTEGQWYYIYRLDQWCVTFTPITKILFEAWEKWVSTITKQMVVESWTRKSIFSVLVTREEGGGRGGGL